MFEGDINNIAEVANYMNSQLNLNRRQGDIEIQDFGVNERVIAKRLQRRSYKKINNQWILQDTPNDTKDTGKSVVKNTSLVQIQAPSQNILTEVRGKTLNIQETLDLESINKLLSLSDKVSDIEYLINNIGILKQVIDSFSSSNSFSSTFTSESQSSGIVIELPVEKDKNFRTTVRINDVIWSMFDDFCQSHQEFTKRDLMSMAFKEYMDKYK